MITGVTSAISITGGTPEEEDRYEVLPVPFAPVAMFSSDPVTTSVTADADATEIALEVTAMSATIDGLPEVLVPGGVLTLEAGAGDCTELVLAEGSSVLTLEVSGAGGAGGSGGAGGAGGDPQ